MYMLKNTRDEGPIIYKPMAWMRVLYVKFTSTKRKDVIVFGLTNSEYQSKFPSLYNKEIFANMDESDSDDVLSIDIEGNKYMSTLKDTCSIRIDNLTYSEIINIIDGEYYDVEVFCGYKNASEIKIFSGGVLYVSNQLNDRKTNTAIILCASKLVAQFGQKRINLSLNSGINMYSAIKFISRQAGITDANISEQFKTKYLQQKSVVSDSVGGWIYQLTNENDMYIANSDNIFGSTFSLFDANDSNRRVINLQESNITLTAGYPRLTTEGVRLTLIPTFPFVCGDVIKLDNSLINMGVSNNDEASKILGNFLDDDGYYMIYEISYSLQNRGSSFSIEILAKSRSQLRKITGVSSNV